MQLVAAITEPVPLTGHELLMLLSPYERELVARAVREADREGRKPTLHGARFAWLGDPVETMRRVQELRSRPTVYDPDD
jgi:hypothetical protein